MLTDASRVNRDVIATDNALTATPAINHRVNSLSLSLLVLLGIRLPSDRHKLVDWLEPRQSKLLSVMARIRIR